MSVHFVQVDVRYEGSLRCEATHEKSGSKLITDAPVDNHGKGESFSPTDLVATGLATCIATTMAIFAERHEIALQGMSITVKKEMTQVPPRRIARLISDITVNLPFDHPHREALERAAQGCPVYSSLHPDVEKVVNFVWQQSTH